MVGASFIMMGNELSDHLKVLSVCFVFFFKQKTAYEIRLSLVGSEMCIRDRGLKPEYVAEHIVFLGSATMKKVLKDGVSRTLGADVQLYGKRFSPEDADRFLSEDIKRLPEQTTVA